MAIGFPSGTASLTLTNLNNGFATTGTPSYVNVVGMDISPTGDRVFLASRDTDSIYRYDLSTPFDFTTASHVQTLSLGSINPYGIKFNPTGDRLFVLNSTGPFLQWIATGPYTLSTGGAWQSYNYGTANMGNTRGIAFNTDGTKMTVLTYGGTSGIHEFDLTTGFDPSTATYNNVYFNTSTYNISVPMNHWFNSTGTSLYIANNSGNKIHTFYLATPFDISSSNVTVGPVSNTAPGGGEQHQHVFNADETELYVIKSGTSSSGLIVSMSFVEDVGVQDGDEFTFNNRDYIYDGTKGAWEVNSPITVAQTGSPVSDLSELADSTSILSDPANEVLTYADLDAILAVTNPATGQLAFNLDTSDMYIFGGTNWQKVYDEDDLPPPAVWYGDRGVISLGDRSNTKLDTLEYVDITTTGNSTSFGTLSVGQENGSSTAGGDRMVISLGMTATTPATKMEYITTSSPGTATSFGDLSDSRRAQGGVSNGSRGCFGGGPSTMQIDYITIATESNATAFGTHSSGLGQAWGSSGAEDGTYGLFMGIDDSPGADGPIDYITIATESNATLFGQLTSNRTYGCAVSDSTKAVHCGGAGYVTDMHYVNIATPGNSTSFGSLSLGRAYPAGTSNNSRGIISGGYHTGSNSNYTNSIEYIDIATISSASSFGTISSGAHSNGCASSGNAA